MNDRLFIQGVLHHCYQRTSDRGVLFYSLHDHLVFYTIFCTMARRHKLKVLKLVQMPDHIHYAAFAESRDRLSNFSRDYASVFAREFNRCHHRHGPLFESPFGSAPKKTEKDVRSNLIYLDNNPVERHLAKRAEDYRWHYLAYGKCDNPFSDKIVLRRASMPLRRALERVRIIRSEDRPLTYPALQNLLNSIASPQEHEQLIDYIITAYSAIDHAAAIGFFGGYSQELTAAHASKGSEYDIHETFIGWSDTVYERFASMLLRTGACNDVHQVLSMDRSEKLHLAEALRWETRAPWKQIAAFLHLPVETKH